MVLAKPGRRVVHLKGTNPTHPLWTLIEENDYKNVGRCWEIRLDDGDPQVVRAAFDDGLAALLA